MTQITYRQLTETDRDDFARIDAHAFNEHPDHARLTPEVTSQLRGLFADGQLVAQLQLFPFAVMTGGDLAPCGGIGSVAVPPEQRRRGYVAALLRHVCEELRSQGVALCMLFPFQASFYRRYGWVIAMERRIYRGAPTHFASFRNHKEGAFVQVGPEAIPELQQLYQGAMRGRFGPLQRDEAWWQREVLSGWDKSARYHAYIWRDMQGRGRSYLIYRFTNGGRRERALVCREIAALDPVARAQLFAFLADHDAQCGEVVFRAPADAPVNLLMPDPLACEIEPYAMLRLVDVAAALAAFPYPADSTGRLSIAVADDWLEHNQATFALDIAGGRAVVERLPAGSPADLSCDVRVLTQIYTRYLRARSAATFGMLQAHNRAALALLDRLFTGLVPFNSDYF